MELNYLKVLFENVEKAKLKLLVLITMFSELVVRENSLRIVLLCTKLKKKKTNLKLTQHMFEEHNLLC